MLNKTAVDIVAISCCAVDYYELLWIRILLLLIRILLLLVRIFPYYK